MQTHEAGRSGVLSLDDVVGVWRINPVRQGRETCLLALNGLAGKNGYGVHIERCSIRDLGQAHSWRPVERGFELLDASGRAVAAFRREDVDHFRAVNGAYRMERAAEA